MWGEGVNSRCTLLKNIDFTGSLKINIYKVLVLEGDWGSQKEYSVYTLDNVDNSGRPVIQLPISGQQCIFES